MITVYGIKQCDTCRKALKWLQARGEEHRFHDFRVDGLDRDRLEKWMNSEFADVLVNRRSTTWRGLGDDDKTREGEAMVELLLANPALIKRPVFERDAILAVGLKPAELEELL